MSIFENFADIEKILNESDEEDEFEIMTVFLKIYKSVF